MPQGWSRPHDVDLLADGRQSFDVSIPFAELARLGEQLADKSGAVHVVARFWRELGFPVADVAVAADLTLTCQRCLGPMRWPIDSRTRVVLVPDLASADRAPEGLDPVVIEEGRTSVRDLAEEELLLALPLVAMHARPAECGNAAAVGKLEVEAEDSNKPFAQLGELLKRDST
jgi:uncharacterized protein